MTVAGARAANRRVSPVAWAVRVKASFRGWRRCRRVAARLDRDGHPCSVGLVADFMRELGLQACQPQAYRRTIMPTEQQVSSPDLIGPDFTAAAPRTRLVDDIT
jgi:hypothetical protein